MANSSADGHNGQQSKGPAAPNGYRPDVTNYDYVWGSDQSQYLESAEAAAEPEAPTDAPSQSPVADYETELPDLD